MKKIINILLLSIIVLIISCKKETIETTPVNNVSIDVIQKLKEAGFNTSQGPSKTNGGYLVEYDIFIPESDINNLNKSSKINIPLSAKNLVGKSQSREVIEHYRSNNLVLASWNSKRNIEVSSIPYSAPICKLC
ncbi:hypothetical protein [Pedobacter sp. BMA]|uniref:hypothetical protein n=1 Tax=Pedobacter sp. BMA TaxID=1663685 RepID=UPI00069DBB00|nr:hypothetical protein [Pedobacter sp. BMA]